MTFRTTHLTCTGGHAGQDWPTESLAVADMARLTARGDVIAAVLIEVGVGVRSAYAMSRIGYIEIQIIAPRDDGPDHD